MSEDWKAKDVGELLDEVSTKIPKLVKSLMASLYSAEAGKNMGQAVGNLYKELIAADIPKEDALKMAHDYIDSLKSITSNINNNGRNFHWEK